MTNFVSLDKTRSTMQMARDLVDEICPSTDTIILTSHQTAGRGRQGRSWETAQGNLAMTICTLLQPLSFDPKISFVIGLAVWKSIQDLVQGAVKIKWPNDILIDGKKVSGILIENYKMCLLTGIGVNLVSHPQHLSATHLAAYDVSIDYQQLARCIYHNVSLYTEVFRNQGFNAIRTAWLAQAAFIGQEISVSHVASKRKLSGKFTDIDLQGSLMLQCPSNQIVKIHAGDIFPAS